MSILRRISSIFSGKRIHRPAFLLHTTELANHFEPIWDALPPHEFDILLYGGARLPDHLPRPSWRCDVRTVEEVLGARERYDVLISNHPVDLSSGRGLRKGIMVKRLADKNVRMMYAAGKAGWNMSDWNRVYDGVLCFGPHHAKAFAEKFGLPVFQMGYPRFDKYFTADQDAAELHARFGCDPGKQTVVWLPTWKSLSSVGHFNDEIAALMPEFNVVVKVHPLMPDDEPERVEALSRLGFNALITDASDNVSLYRLADYMLFDYGGPAFGAIYTGKRFILLNVPDASDDSLAGSESPDVLLRRHLVNVDPGTNAIRDLLSDGPHWQAHKKSVNALRQTYFVDNFGNSAEVAAAAILDRSWLEEKGSPDW